MISTLNVGARYFSIFLLCAGPFVGLNIQIAWETTVVPRPRTKRAALIAIANCVSSVGPADRFLGLSKNYANSIQRFRIGLHHTSF